MAQKDAFLEVVLAGGKRVDVHVAGHTIHTDQPLDNGGENTAPTPFQLFLSSIGACAGIYIQGFLSKRGIATEGITLSQRMVYDGAGDVREVHTTVHVTPLVPEKYHAALIKVAEQCTVKKAIVGQPRFFVSIAS